MYATIVGAAASGKQAATAPYDYPWLELSAPKAISTATQKQSSALTGCICMVQVIGELDEKKREALHASWVKVNQDFGAIFTSLLPGTMAKLEPPEGQSFLAGLEVKVLLNPVCCLCIY